MTWLTWLILAAVVTAIAAVTGIKPKGTRHVARTSISCLPHGEPDHHHRRGTGTSVLRGEATS